MKFTVTAGTAQGAYETLASHPSFSVRPGIYNSPTPASDYDQHFLVEGSRDAQEVGGQFMGPEWTLWLLTDEHATPKTGDSIPVVFSLYSPHNPVANQDIQSIPSSLTADQMNRYPGAGGTCTLVTDYARRASATETFCFRARFSCTGLVGHGSGTTFDVTNGVLSYGAE